jgi:hypothetical protein
LLRYQDCVKLLELVLQNWDAEADERTKQALAKWKAEGDLQPWELARRSGGGKLHGEDKVAISFDIRPGRQGWYLVIDVAATLAEERKLWGSAAHGDQPATKPSPSAR